MLLNKFYLSGAAEKSENNNVLHKIDPNSEYISPINPKPNPRDLLVL